MGEWLGLIGALLGAAVGGVVTYIVQRQQHKHEVALDQGRRRLEALESIYGLLTLTLNQASVLSISIIGQYGYNSPIKADILSEKVQFDRLRMLVDFHAPTLLDDIGVISERLDCLGANIAEALLHKDPSEQSKSSLVKSSALASQELAKAARSAQGKLALIVRALSAKV